MTIIEGGQYVEVSVLVSADVGATYDELNEARLVDAPVLLRE